MSKNKGHGCPSGGRHSTSSLAALCPYLWEKLESPNFRKEPHWRPRDALSASYATDKIARIVVTPRSCIAQPRLHFSSIAAELQKRASNLFLHQLGKDVLPYCTAKMRLDALSLTGLHHEELPEFATFKTELHISGALVNKRLIEVLYLSHQLL